MKWGKCEADRLETSRRDLVLTGSACLGLAPLSGFSALAASPPLMARGGGQFIELDPREDVSLVAVTDFAGKKRALSEFRGQPILLAFWASWCPPCLHELPILHRLQLERRLGFSVVPVSLDRDAAIASRFIDRLGLKGFRSYIDGAGIVASGPKSAVQTTFQLYGMPMSYVVDGTGRAAGYLVGAADWSTPEARLIMAHYSR